MGYLIQKKMQKKCFNLDKQLRKDICFLLYVLLVCIFFSNCKASEKNTTFNSNVIFKRKVIKRKEIYGVIVNIKFKKKIEGYLVFKDEFSDSILVNEYSKYTFEPYYISNNEVRFVLDNNFLTKKRRYKFKYFFLLKNNYKEYSINGTIRYLSNNIPMPEMKNNFTLNTN